MYSTGRQWRATAPNMLKHGHPQILYLTMSSIHSPFPKNDVPPRPRNEGSLEGQSRGWRPLYDHLDLVSKRLRQMAKA